MFDNLNIMRLDPTYILCSLLCIFFFYVLATTCVSPGVWHYSETFLYEITLFTLNYYLHFILWLNKTV